jgi:competence protein ComEA
LLLLLVFAGKFLLHAGTAVAPLPEPPVTPTVPAASVVLVVDVVGAVRRPGLYRLRQGGRVADAVARAGGVTGRAEPDLVNLAAPLVDGEQVVIPARGAAPAAAGGTGGPSNTTPVQLSTATLEQLDALPGIGPAMAQRIVDYRTEHGGFRSVDELDAIPGIGPARLDELRKWLVP